MSAHMRQSRRSFASANVDLATGSRSPMPYIKVCIVADRGFGDQKLYFVGPGGRARVLRGALVTTDRYQVGTVLCVQDKEMKQAWCLAASSTSATSRVPPLASLIVKASKAPKKRGAD